MADSSIYNLMKPNVTWDLNCMVGKLSYQFGSTLNSTIVFSMHDLHFDIPNVCYFKDMNYLSYIKFDHGITVTN